MSVTVGRAGAVALVVLMLTGCVSAMRLNGLVSPSGGSAAQRQADDHECFEVHSQNTRVTGCC
jgi:outer membrane murein-binding lipoprotein Lpp